MHLSVKVKVKSLPWPMDLLSMLGSGWEFPQERGGGGGDWGVGKTFASFFSPFDTY